ncbi:MAG: hypothetical protein IKE55_08665 [Kiritimatiellae bacterium]|nr:hypothetical protein [Kiritimatiellia bacterium]
MKTNRCVMLIAAATAGFEEASGIAEVYMNRTKKLVLAAGLTLLGGTAALGENARGYFNNWEDDCQLKQTGNYYSGTLQAHAGGSAGLKFDKMGSTK